MLIDQLARGVARSLVLAVLAAGCAAQPATSAPRVDSGLSADAGGDSGPRSDLGARDAASVVDLPTADLIVTDTGMSTDAGAVDLGRDAAGLLDLGTDLGAELGVDLGVDAALPLDLGTDLGTPAARNALTFGITSMPPPPIGTTLMNCHGDPPSTGSMDRSPSCDPYEGDTSCSEAHPILCFYADGSAAPSSGSHLSFWGGGVLGSTDPVVGTSIGSLANADALCASQVGPGFVMAEFHLGGGWAILGTTAPSGIDLTQRHWVTINDRASECWD